MHDASAFLSYHFYQRLSVRWFLVFDRLLFGAAEALGKSCVAQDTQLTQTPWLDRGTYENSIFKSVSQEECDETREQGAFCSARNDGVMCRSFSTDFEESERSAESISVRRYRWSGGRAHRALYRLRWLDDPQR